MVTAEVGGCAGLVSGVGTALSSRECGFFVTGTYVRLDDTARPQ